jgi:hypothetical protein
MGAKCNFNRSFLITTPYLQLKTAIILYFCKVNKNQHREMRKMLCPQCKIAAMYVKNEAGDRRLVYVVEGGEVIPKNPEESLDGFDVSEVFCLGCSWHGNPKKLVRY